MTTAESTQLLTAAATAAVPLLPLPPGAQPQPASVADLPGDWPAVRARFTGTPSGWLALLLEPGLARSLADALQQAATAEGADAGQGLAVACQAALEAALQAMGPTAALPVEETGGADITAEAASAQAVALGAAGGTPVAYAVLAVHDGPTASGSGQSGGVRGLDLLRSVPMEVTAEIGRTRMTIQELLGLVPGTVVELDRPVGSPADVLVNGKLFARGEVVVVDEDFAIRVTEIVDESEGAGA